MEKMWGQNGECAVNRGGTGSGQHGFTEQGQQDAVQKPGVCTDSIPILTVQPLDGTGSEQQQDI